MKLKELIADLNSYPPDMNVAKKDTPFEDVEVQIRHAKNDEEEFDYVSIE